MTLMYGVKNQWNLAISIGGKDLAPADPTGVKKLLWFESIHQALPSLNLEFIDLTGAFSTITASGDGVPIDITLGDGDYSGETTSRFNIQGQPQLTHGNGYNLIKLNAVLDNLSYMRQVSSGLFNGTSSSVLGQIAAKVGLKFDGATTSDAMAWLPNNKTLYGFAKAVANHGWIDAASCLIHAVTDQKELVYKNVMQPDSVGETFESGSNESVQIVDWSATSNGLITNNNRGYGSTSFGFNAEGLLQEFNKITFNLLTNVLGVSTANINALGALGGRLDNIIRSAGNTHDNYDQAKHQNQRLRSLFSSDINLVTAQVTQSKLLHSISAVPFDFSTGNANPVYTGDYVMTSRTKSLIRSKYVERIVASSQGAAS